MALKMKTKKKDGCRFMAERKEEDGSWPLEYQKNQQIHNYNDLQVGIRIRKKGILKDIDKMKWMK
jgi:hypothetical protein